MRTPDCEMRDGLEDGNSDCIFLKDYSVLWLLCDGGLGIHELGVLKLDDILVAE